MIKHDAGERQDKIRQNAMQEDREDKTEKTR